MPSLFSYGSLQREDIQLATFSRLLGGEHDALVGYEPSSVPITDAAVARRIGRTHHDNVTLTDRSDSRVQGMRFDVTDAELAQADVYEAEFDYARVAARLASGAEAWVYVHAPAGTP